MVKDNGTSLARAVAPIEHTLRILKGPNGEDHQTRVITTCSSVQSIPPTTARASHFRSVVDVIDCRCRCVLQTLSRMRPLYTASFVIQTLKLQRLSVKCGHVSLCALAMSRNLAYLVLLTTVCQAEFIRIFAVYSLLYLGIKANTQ